MSDTGFTVSGMIEPVSGYDVTVTVDRDGGYLLDPAEFAVAAGAGRSHQERQHGERAPC
jgi:hypothetical protein